MDEHTLGALLKKGTAILENSGIEEAGQDAWLLLEYATGKDRTYYFSHMQDAATAEQEGRYLKLLKKRSLRIPLQHLTHQAFFMGHEFYVDGRVLIPRQDTEVLAEEALKRLKGKKAPRILDMCTGSGCILISLLLERTDARGVGADISGDALDVAKENARRLGAGDRAQFVKSDLFAGAYFSETGGKEEAKYDILISNPPYIPTAEIQELMEEVRLFDPRQALDGREDGLYFYREILKAAGEYLREDGWLLFEIGCSQGAAVAELFYRAGYGQVEIIRDLSGLDRVVCGKAPAKAAQGQE